jgi:hypothetical protein
MNEELRAKIEELARTDPVVYAARTLHPDDYVGFLEHAVLGLAAARPYVGGAEIKFEVMP